jgi:N-acetyl-anhydromuramyl-L-alanine amidase AmpD
MQIIETDWEWAGGSGFEKRTSGEYLIYHHAAANCTAEAVHRYHKSRGWIGIGYHYFIDKKGNIWRGRPEYAAGAHCAGKNYDSIAICFEGNFEKETMNAAQMKAGSELTADIRGRYPGMIAARHRDFAATACPGKNFPFDELDGRAAPPRFADAAGHWAEESIAACAAAGLLMGREDGLFHPDEAATRAEMAAALSRLLERAGG